MGKNWIKKIYKRYIKESLNNQELTEEQLEKIDSVIATYYEKYFGYNVNHQNKTWFKMISKQLREIDFLAEVVQRITDNHILPNGNKRLALTILVKLSDIILIYGMKADTKELVELVRNIASHRYNLKDIVSWLKKHINNCRNDFIFFNLEDAIKILEKE